VTRVSTGSLMAPISGAGHSRLATQPPAAAPAWVRGRSGRRHGAPHRCSRHCRSRSSRSPGPRPRTPGSAARRALDAVLLAVDHVGHLVDHRPPTVTLLITSSPPLPVVHLNRAVRVDAGSAVLVAPSPNDGAHPPVLRRLGVLRQRGQREVLQPFRWRLRGGGTADGSSLRWRRWGERPWRYGSGPPGPLGPIGMPPVDMPGGIIPAAASPVVVNNHYVMTLSQRWRG
jgi:hypothetical protein